jgi:hypothetical protein
VRGALLHENPRLRVDERRRDDDKWNGTLKDGE